jgi:hypothetical protein
VAAAMQQTQSSRVPAVTAAWVRAARAFASNAMLTALITFVATLFFAAAFPQPSTMIRNTVIGAVKKVRGMFTISKGEL